MKKAQSSTNHEMLLPTEWAKGRRTLRGLLGSAFRLLPSAFCLLLTAYCLLPTVLNAQGCAMCYTSASAARAGAKEALANGVLILLVPPMVFFALITVVIYIYRNKFRDSENWRPEHDRELQKLLADLAPAKGTQQIGRSADRVIG
jgi:hypothetical protein